MSKENVGSDHFTEISNEQLEGVAGGVSLADRAAQHIDHAEQGVKKGWNRAKQWANKKGTEASNWLNKHHF